MADPKKKNKSPQKIDPVKNAVDNWRKLPVVEQEKTTNDIIAKGSPLNWTDEESAIISEYLKERPRLKAAQTQQTSQRQAWPSKVVPNVAAQISPPDSSPNNVAAQISPPNNSPNDAASQISLEQAKSAQQSLLNANIARAQALDPASGSSYRASSSVTNSATNRTKEAELYDQFANAYNQYQLELQKQRELAAYGNPNSDYAKAITSDRYNFQSPYTNGNYVPGGSYTSGNSLASVSSQYREPLPYEKPLPVTSTTTGANTVSGSVGAEQRFAPASGVPKERTKTVELKVPISADAGKPGVEDLSKLATNSYLPDLWTRYNTDSIKESVDKVVDPTTGKRSDAGRTTNQVRSATSTNHVWDTIGNGMLNPGGQFTLYSGKREQPDILYDMAKKYNNMTNKAWFELQTDKNTGEQYLTPSKDLKGMQEAAIKAIGNELANGTTQDPTKVIATYNNGRFNAYQFLTDFKKQMYDSFANQGADALARSIAQNPVGGYRNKPIGAAPDEFFRESDMQAIGAQLVLVKIIDNMMSASIMPKIFAGRK